MNDQAIQADAHAARASCENCAAPLQGRFCHDCGQSVHNPIRHVGHAIEEFFEAFWHLDGRVFRTLRDLQVPGRVAIGYLAGHRARYIAPLRMFVVLSVLTFFIGSAAVHVDGDVVQVSGDPAGGSAEAVRPADPSPSRLQFNTLGHRGYWHPEENPVVVRWWPGFANDWLNRKIGNLEKNLQTLERSSADAWLQAVMSAAPTALFLLVPVFALLLKIAYVFTRRLYLEHLVVALYSHAFLLVMAMLAFVLRALGDWAEATVFGPVFDLAVWAVVVWMPVYLLLMQRRAYGQAWWLTTLKFVVIGYIYFWMLGTATVLIFLAQLTSA